MFYLHSLGYLAGAYLLPKQIAVTVVFWLVSGLFPKTYPYLIVVSLLIASL
jgi:hypothetical protein